MDESFSFDAFKVCWDIILQESAQCGEKFFNSEHCKILDSRDNNFNVVENRLAYIYKYGYFNILFFEKCFLLFINQCSDALFPFDNLKVCSLSNGPGFDIIGLLSALRSSNKRLKCLPVFNAINVHESWSRLYETLVCKAYKTCIVNSFTEYFHLNPMNINLIQDDIYSALSSESKYIISNSNVLLMVNVFVSSKASPTTFENSLKEIFALLQPESLIFFIGSKNNMKLFSKLNMKQYVKCVCGPQEVTLNDLPINEQISNVIGVNPCNSGHAKFVVWQKRLNTGDENESSGENVADECDVSDTLSELSISSTVENSDELNSKSIDSSTEEIKSKLSISKPHSLSQNFISSNSFENVTKLVNYSFQQNNVSVVKDSKILEESIKINGTSPANAKTDAANNVEISPVHQFTNSKPMVDQNTSNTKSKKKESLNKDAIIFSRNAQENNSDHSKILQRKSSSSVTCENTLKNEKEASFPATNTEGIKYTNSNVQALLQRCDSLISKLEELTVDIKSDLNSSRKRQTGNKTQFPIRQTENCQIHHHACCVRVVHSCCCKKICKN